jgi:hypothetical protein
LEFSVLEAGNGLLDEQSRLLVDGRTGYRGLGETGSDRCLEARSCSLRDSNEVCRKRGVSSHEVSHKRFDGSCVGIRGDEGLRICFELAN